MRSDRTSSQEEPWERLRKKINEREAANPASLSWLRAMTLRQWRHGDPVKNPLRNVKHAGDLVDALAKEFASREGLEEEKLREVWQAVAGDFIYKHTKVDSLKNGVLSLRVVQPSLRFQLEQSKGMLLRKIQADLGTKYVRSIAFRL